MNISIQKVLAPAQRSSALAADAFLAPMEEVFEFLEDVITVRIGYALGAGRYHEAKYAPHGLKPQPVHAPVCTRRALNDERDRLS